MFGLPWIDILTIVGYFAVVLGIGFWALRRIHNQEDYFLAGRRFGKFVQTFAAFGQGTSADTAVSVVVLVARNGLAGVWVNLLSVFQLPIYWVTSVWYRRLRLLTLGDFFEERYHSKWLPGIYTVVSSMMFMLVVAIGFSAMSKTVVAITEKPAEKYTAAQQAEYELATELKQLGETDARLLSAEQKQRLEELRLIGPQLTFSYVDEKMLIAIVALVVVAYAVMGGLEAAFLTDTMQGIFIIILSLLLLPFAFNKVNTLFGGEGISGVIEIARSQLSQARFEIWGSTTMLDFTWYFAIAWFVMTTINTVVQANNLVSTGSAKDEYTARYGFCVGIYLKRFTTLFWGITALVLIIIYGDQTLNPDYIWGTATKDLLGSLGFGLVGLMIACLMAALMSTADCLMLTSSGLMTHNVFRPLLPGRSENTYIWMGRVFGGVFILGGVLIAYAYDNLFDMLKLMWEFNISLAASFWLGILWRRANQAGAWASMTSTLVIFAILPAVIPLFSGIRTSAYLTKTVEPIKVVNTYVARDIDVNERQQEIAEWDALKAHQLSNGEVEYNDSDSGKRPQPLTVGQEFQKTELTPRRAIFWDQGVRTDSNGQVYGKGMLYLEMVLLDRFGFDLSANPYALNETIRYCIRMIWPFLILIIISRLTRQDDRQRLDRFYAKMKTPAIADRQEDDRQLELSYADPSRFDHKKMFPKSNWEIEKLTSTDIKGIVGFFIGGCIILLLVWLISLIGK